MQIEASTRPGSPFFHPSKRVNPRFPTPTWSLRLQPEPRGSSLGVMRVEFVGSGAWGGGSCRLSVPLRLRRPPPKPQMRSAVVSRQAVLIQALGFRFCRAGSWAPDSCRSLPPGPPNGAAVRGDPEVGIEVGTKPGPCETGLEAKRSGLPLSSERKIGDSRRQENAKLPVRRGPNPPPPPRVPVGISSESAFRACVD